MASQQDFFGGRTDFKVIAKNEEEFEQLKGSRISTTEKVLTGAHKVAREVPGAVLFTLGDFFGTLFGGPAGGAAGAAAGAGLGETIVQGAEIIGGQREELDEKEIAKEAGVAGSIALVTPPLISTAVKLGKGTVKVAGKTVAPFARIAKSGVQGIKKVLPGISDETALMIKQFPKEVETLATKKTLPINPIVEELQKARKIIIKNSGKAFEKSLKKARKAGETFKLDAKKFNESVKRILSSPDLNVKVVGGKFDFSKSAFGSKSTKDAVKRVVNEIRTSIPEVKDVDSLRLLRKRLFDIIEDSKRGFTKAPPAFRAINQIKESVDDLLPKAMKEANKKFKESKDLVSFIEKELIPADKAGNIKKTAISRINQLTKSEEVNLLFEGKLKEIEKASGLQVGKVVELLSAAREINPNLIQQDIGGVVRGIQKAANPVIGQTKLEAAKLNRTDAAKTMRFIQENLGIGIREFLEKAKQLQDPAIKLGLFELLTDFLIKQEEK